MVCIVGLVENLQQGDVRYENTIEGLKGIVRNPGWRQLFAGLSINYMKMRICFRFIKFSTFDIVSTYEMSALKLVNNRESVSAYCVSALPESFICHTQYRSTYQWHISTSFKTKDLCGPDTTHDILLKRLELALKNHEVKEAWEVFNDFKRLYGFPVVSVVSKLITELSYSSDQSWLHKACSLALRIAKEKPELQQHNILTRVCLSLSRAQMPIHTSKILRFMLRKHSMPPMDVLLSVMMHMVKTEVGIYLASNILIEICECFHQLSAKKSDLAATVKPGTMIFNLVLNGCVRTRSSLKGVRIIESMAKVGVAADVHSIILFACIYEMNNQRDELKRFKDHVQQVSGPLVLHYRQFYESLLSLHFKFDDLDAACILVADIYKCRESYLTQGNKDWTKSFLVPIGSYYQREGLKIQIMPTLLQKESVLHVEDTRELVLFEKEKLFLSNKALAQFLIRCKRGGRIGELSKLLIEIQRELDSLEYDNLCTNVIDSCIRVGWLEMAHDIVDDMEFTGAPIHPSTYMLLLRAYCKEGMPREARALVNQMKRAGFLSNISNEIVVSQCFSEIANEGSLKIDGRLEKTELAECLIREMKEEHSMPAVVYELNSALYFFCKANMIDDALKTYRRMQAMNIQPSVQTYAYLIEVYSSLEMHRQITILWGDIKRYMEHGYLVACRDLYELLLVNFIRGGYFERVLEVVNYMEEQDMYVDKWTYKNEFFKYHRNLYRSLTASDAKDEVQRQRVEHVKAFRKWLRSG
ncbi:hypothetical protein Ancab_012546 [Ancistrocladus abbreviatus]